MTILREALISLTTLSFTLHWIHDPSAGKMKATPSLFCKFRYVPVMDGTNLRKKQHTIRSAPVPDSRRSQIVFMSNLTPYIGVKFVFRDTSSTKSGMGAITCWTCDLENGLVTIPQNSTRKKWNPRSRKVADVSVIPIVFERYAMHIWVIEKAKSDQAVFG